MANDKKFFSISYHSHHVVLERTNKFGKLERLYRIDYDIIQSRSTEKAYAVGAYYSNKPTVYGFVAKSMVVEYDGNIYAPGWILDKMNVSGFGSDRYAHNNDYYYEDVFNLDTQTYKTCISEARYFKLGFDIINKDDGFQLLKDNEPVGTFLRYDDAFDKMREDAQKLISDI